MNIAATTYTLAAIVAVAFMASRPPVEPPSPINAAPSASTQSISETETVAPSSPPQSSNPSDQNTEATEPSEATPTESNEGSADSANTEASDSEETTQNY